MEKDNLITGSSDYAYSLDSSSSTTSSEATYYSVYKNFKLFSEINSYSNFKGDNKVVIDKKIFENHREQTIGKIILMIIEKVYETIKSNKILGIIFSKEQTNDKIRISVNISKMTNGGMIDLSNNLNEILFNETDKINDSSKRLDILNLFQIQVTDVENGIEL